MRKVILYIAVSLDGYIADPCGAVDWLGGQNSSYQGDYGYQDFISGIDTVVMGYTTYHQIATELFPNQWPYSGIKSYVLTHRQLANSDEIQFINRPILEWIESLKAEQGKAIWICGGANIIHQLMEHDLMDEYHISIMPILLGKGIRLFTEHDWKIPLQLVSSSPVNGVLNCVYHKR